METLRGFARSSVGRKILMAFTGLAWVLFVIAHLVGNFTILMGADAFNGYAYFLEHLMHGIFIYIAEAGLILLLFIHAGSGVRVFLSKRKARAVGYRKTADAGGASQKSWASRSMIITGPLLLIFIVLHLLHLKFGPGMSESYVYNLHGKEVRDLYLLVIEEFQIGWKVGGYVVIMMMLGLHLRHGFWSGLQSLGLTREKNIPTLTKVSLALGTILAIGFIYIPLHIFFFIEPASAIAAAAGGAH